MSKIGGQRRIRPGLTADRALTGADWPCASPWCAMGVPAPARTIRPTTTGSYRQSARWRRAQLRQQALERPPASRCMNAWAAKRPPFPRRPRSCGAHPRRTALDPLPPASVNQDTAQRSQATPRRTAKGLYEFAWNESVATGRRAAQAPASIPASRHGRRRAQPLRPSPISAVARHKCCPRCSPS